MPRSRVLKKWNGRLLSHRVIKVVSGMKDWPLGSVPDRGGHVFVGAYSVADARVLWRQAFGCDIPTSEVRNYWSKNCWGNAMDGVPFERGIWVMFDRHGANPIGPLRVI